MRNKEGIVNISSISVPRDQNDIGFDFHSTLSSESGLNPPPGYPPSYPPSYRAAVRDAVPSYQAISTYVAPADDDISLSDSQLNIRMEKYFQRAKYSVIASASLCFCMALSLPIIYRNGGPTEPWQKKACIISFCVLSLCSLALFCCSLYLHSEAIIMQSTQRQRERIRNSLLDIVV